MIDDIVFYPLGNIYYNKYNKLPLQLPFMCANGTGLMEKEIFSKSWILNTVRSAEAIVLLDLVNIQKII